MRYDNITYMRVIAMALVVLYHSYCYYGIWNFEGLDILCYKAFADVINYIHMPMFVFASGHIFQNLASKGRYDSTKLFVTNKIKRLLIPYFIWGLVIVLIMPARYDISMFLTGISHLWFLLMLFGIFMIVHPFRKQLSSLPIKSKIHIVTFFAILYLLVSRYVQLENFIAFKMVFRYLPIFMLGGIASLDNIHKHLSIRTVTCIVILLSLEYIKMNLSNSFVITSLMYFTSIVLVYCIYEVVSTMAIANPLSNNSMGGAINSLDKCGMGIYIIHHIVIIYALQFENVRDVMNTHYIIAPILAFMSLILISWFITWAILKSSYIKWIFG